MNKYFFLIYLSFKSSIAYRAEVLFKIIQSFIILSVQVFLWKTLYTGANIETAISLQDMITYLILSTGIGILLFDNSVMVDIGGDVKNGTISGNLARPLNYMFTKCAHLAGRLLFLFLFTVVPMLLLAIVIYGFSFPEKLYQLLLSMIFIGNAYFIFFIFFFL